MKSILLATALIFMVSCSSDTATTLDPSTTDQEQMATVTLDLDFTTSETTLDNTSATRASSTPPSRIALHIFNTDGTSAYEQINQITGDQGFGTFTDLRIAPGSYKCAIVAHRASSAENPAAIITSLTEASIPETNLWDTYTTVYDLTVAPATYSTQRHTITIPLCVTRLSLTILDAIPSSAKQLRLTLNSGATQTVASPIILSPTDKLATTDLAFDRTWDIPVDLVGAKNKEFVITGLFNAYPKDCDAKVEALDSEGATIFSRTFQNITFNRGKVRKISTNLFTGSVDATINFEEWIDEETPIIIK